MFATFCHAYFCTCTGPMHVHILNDLRISSPKLLIQNGTANIKTDTRRALTLNTIKGGKTQLKSYFFKI